jgi:hypothetical protein
MRSIAKNLSKTNFVCPNCTERLLNGAFHHAQLIAVRSEQFAAFQESSTLKRT